MTTHSFTVDVEDWYHGAPDPVFRSTAQRRLHVGVDALLELLAEAETKATFFWLGAAAKDHPQVLQRVVAQGHEIGCHGDEHVRDDGLEPTEMLVASKKAKQTLEQIAGKEVVWYRAPYFSLPQATTWGAEALLEAGFTHDSSILAGTPCAWSATGLRGPTELHTRSGTLIEAPITAYRIGGRSIPAAGGGAFRLAPYAVTKAIFTNEGARCRATNFYVHPWELDKQRPRCQVGKLEALRNGIGRHSTYAKLQRLLRDFSFQPLGETIGKWRSSCGPELKVKGASVASP